jgi:tetratricopeptide (TPR) repeat protein
MRKRNRKSSRKSTSSTVQRPAERSPQDVSRRPHYRWRSKLLLALTALVAGLAIGELASRLLGLAPAVKAIEVTNPDCVYKRSTNPILAYELKANYRNDDADLGRSYPRTNAHGQRDIERSREKPAGTRRILLLGDSVVEGHGIREIDDTMSRQLEMLYDDGQTEVLNFGVSGYCTLAEAELLEVKGLDFEPDTVLVVFVDNDFDDFNIEGFQLGRARQRPILVKQLFVHSSLFRAACLRFNLFQFGVEHDPVRWNQQAIGDNNVVEGLERLSRMAREHGFQTAIAIWPRFTDGEIIDAHPMPNNPRQLIIERLAAMYGIPATRLSPHFQRHRSSDGPSVNPRQRYTIGDMFHPSEEGCQVAAAGIKDILDRLESRAETGGTAAETNGTFAPDPAAVAAATAAGGFVPNYATVENNLGRQAEVAGDLEKALVHYQEAVRLGPDYEVAHRSLGQALCNLGRMEEGVLHLRRALEIRPVYPEAHRNLGVALEWSGQLDQSEWHLREAIRIQPNYANAYSNLGVTLMKQGKFDDALQNLQRAIEIEPTHEEAHNNLGYLWASRKRFDQAQHHLEQALRANPDNTEARYYLATYYHKQAKLDDAIKQYQHVLSVEPENINARTNLGTVLTAQGRLDEAMVQFREVLRINPKYQGAQKNLNTVLQMKQAAEGE